MQQSRDASGAIRQGLTFLERQQEPDGSFVSYSSPSMRNFRRIRRWQTTFVPALMLASLSGLESPRAMVTRKKLAGFLMKQRSVNWSFNYWAKGAPERKTQPYPDDLDDTFCALVGLYLHDSSIVDETVLARVVKLLLATEVSVGGPYRTWLVPADSTPVWTDVDVAVNSNVNYFLTLVSNGLPKLDAMMGEAIRSDSFSSPYYPSVYAFIYYFARSYRGSLKVKLLDKARRLHKTAATDLDRALCLSARLRLGDKQDLSAAARELLSSQRRDGSWPAAAFYADPVKDGKLYYSGGAALTTAFVLEALELHRRNDAPAAAAGEHDKIKEEVMDLAKNGCRTLERELRDSTLRSLKKMSDSSNGAEIIRLPHRFNESLIKPLMPEDAGLFNKLGLANLYGWLAYTVYDDFLDEEGKPGLLSAANAAMRRSLDGFSEALLDNAGFRLFVRRTFDEIDSANAWEQANCRFKRRGSELEIGPLPDYGDLAKLAQRSLGHTLPSMAILAASGLGPDTRRGGQVLQALRHYLIVRQLNDDAHDWPEDLRNGHVTPVVSHILSDLRIKSGSYTAAELMPAARRQFWYSTLTKVRRLVDSHARTGRQNLANSGLLKTENVVAESLGRLEASMKEAMDKQAQAKNFLKHYKKNAGRT